MKVSLSLPIGYRSPVNLSVEKPFSEACERNQGPILTVLRRAVDGRVLEIGSGTGQHGVYFARALAGVTWQPSDLADRHPGIDAWRQEAKLTNLLPPIEIVLGRPWPEVTFDHVFTANTLHIVAWPLVEALFLELGRRLPTEGRFLVYGPFNVGGKFTSPSNEEFDRFLRTERSPESGLRDLEKVRELAGRNGLTLAENLELPANNRMLVFAR